MVSTRVTLCGVEMDNPVIPASGTFGYGSEYSTIFDVNKLGGICSKGLTLLARPGNTGVRLVETPSGLINSIGLENPGIEHFIEHELPSMLALKPVTIANLSGSSIHKSHVLLRFFASAFWTLWMYILQIAQKRDIKY